MHSLPMCAKLDAGGKQANGACEAEHADICFRVSNRQSADHDVFISPKKSTAASLQPRISIVCCVMSW